MLYAEPSCEYFSRGLSEVSSRPKVLSDENGGGCRVTHGRIAVSGTRTSDLIVTHGLILHVICDV